MYTILNLGLQKKTSKRQRMTEHEIMFMIKL